MGWAKEIISAGVKFTCGDYSEIDLPPYSLVYCDIPYRDTKKYASALKFDYERFYNWCKKIAAMGHEVFVSEHWMPDDFTVVWEKEQTNSMALKNTHKVIEKLFTLK